MDGAHCGAAEVDGGTRRSEAAPGVLVEVRSYPEVDCAALEGNAVFRVLSGCVGSLQLGGSLGYCEAGSGIVGM